MQALYPTFLTFLPALWFSPRSAHGRRTWAFRTRVPQCIRRGFCFQSRLPIYGVTNAFVPAGTGLRRMADFVSGQVAFSQVSPLLTSGTRCHPPKSGA
jgi:hypothetical protein